MITIATKTKRITLKLSEEESSRMFDTLVSSLLELPKTEPPKTEPPQMQESEEKEVTAPLMRERNTPVFFTSNAQTVGIP